MKELRGKRADAYRRAYWHYSHKDLYECYKSPSLNKIHIFNYYREYMKEVDGYGLRIISYNSNHFTLGYLTVEHINSIPAGFLNIVTPYNKYKIRLS